jgi:hypothetical protein
MRTTIRLDDQLLKSAKRYAQEAGKSLTAVIEDGLRQILARQKAKGSRAPVKLSTVGGKGVRPGIDLDDSASLLAHMDESHGSS